MDQLNEDVEVVSEKAVSQAQQKAAGAALSAKRGDTPKSELTGASKEMLDMSEKELEDFAGTKHKGIPKKKTNESFEDLNSIRKLSGLDEADEQDIMDKLQQIADGPDGEDELLMKMEMGIGEEGMFLRKLYDKVSNQMFSKDSGDLEDPEDFDKVHLEVMQMFGIEAEPLASLQQKAKDREISSALSDPELTGMEQRETASNEFDSAAFREAFEAMVESKFKKGDKVTVDGEETEITVPDGPGPLVGVKKDGKTDMVKADKVKKKTDTDESVEEGKSKHPKGSEKYKKQMAAKHASMNEEDMDMDIDANMDMPVDQTRDKQMDYGAELTIDRADEVDMAMGQLEFIKYGAEEIKGHFKMGFEMEEWFQNKLARVHGTMMTLHAYIEGEEGKAGMNESMQPKKKSKNKMTKEQEVDEAGKLKGGGDDPCWKGYKMVGMKKKGGKEVPNCVPRESLGEDTSFEDLVKLFKESGGQQKIYATDETLFKWAARVAESKFGRTTKAELYAGIIYERNGGDFEIADVLQESTGKKPEGINEDVSTFVNAGIPKEYAERFLKKYQVKHDAEITPTDGVPKASDIRRDSFIINVLPNGDVRGFGKKGDEWKVGKNFYSVLHMVDGKFTDTGYESLSAAKKGMSKQGKFYTLDGNMWDFYRDKKPENARDTRGDVMTGDGAIYKYMNDTFMTKMRPMMEKMVDDIYANLRKLDNKNKSFYSPSDQERALEAAQTIEAIAERGFNRSTMENFLTHLKRVSHGFASIPANERELRKILKDTPNARAKWAKTILDAAKRQHDRVKKMLYGPTVNALKGEPQNA